jgi:acyl dehydratase
MLDRPADVFIENRTFDELTLGETASLSHTVIQRDIDLFAVATGDVNPAHVDPAYAETDSAARISTRAAALKSPSSSPMRRPSYPATRKRRVLRAVA